MLNSAQLQGRFTQDPELREVGNDKIHTVSFTLAVSRSYVDKASGEREADFIDCVAWRGQADFICKNFKKGESVIVEGTLQTRTYEDSNGSNRKVTELLVNSIHFVGAGKKSDD